MIVLQQTRISLNDHANSETWHSSAGRYDRGGRDGGEPLEKVEKVEIVQKVEMVEGKLSENVVGA